MLILAITQALRCAARLRRLYRVTWLSQPHSMTLSDRSRVLDMSARCSLLSLSSVASLGLLAS
eukprot:6178692-Pleurochrysis_carterae.AAC.2